MKKKKTAPKKTKIKSAAKKIVHTKHKNFYEILSNKREGILSTAKQKGETLAFNEVGDEADVASQTFEREMMFEMTNGERIVLDDVQAALRKIEKDDFGNCESCRKKITQQRLKAMPWARYCIQCQSRAESPRGK